MPPADPPQQGACADIHGPKPYECVRFGDIHGPKPYKFMGFGDIHGPRAYKFIGFGGIQANPPGHRPQGVVTNNAGSYFVHKPSIIMETTKNQSCALET